MPSRTAPVAELWFDERELAGPCLRELSLSFLYMMASQPS
jgi:hypothetical protein